MWQSVSNPPKEFMPVLVFEPGRRHAHIVQEMPDEMYVAYLKRGKFYLQADDYNILSPTHWMPLPKPPHPSPAGQS